MKLPVQIGDACNPNGGLVWIGRDRLGVFSHVTWEVCLATDVSPSSLRRKFDSSGDKRGGEGEGGNDLGVEKGSEGGRGHLGGWGGWGRMRG